MTTVLITGFGRFPGAPFNPSAPLALALAKRRRPALAGVTRIAHVFATGYAAVDRDLPGLLARHKPDVVLMLGLAARTPFVRIETRARNAVSVLFPDVAGYLPTERAIAPSGPPSLRGRAPVTRLLAAARSARVPARLSRDAGRYLCNYVYWRALETSRSGTLAQFVHIPPLRNIRPADLVRAGEAILLALLAAHRR
jgi:pyroglutamyl-peptidase